jgi:hypothetical protein
MPAPVPASIGPRPGRALGRSQRLKHGSTVGRRVLVLAFAAVLVGIVALAAELLRADTSSAPPPNQPRPTLSPAAALPASRAAPGDPRAWVVPLSEFGPGWIKTKESVAGSTDQLAVYEVEYANTGGSPETAGFSLFSASSAADADAGLQQLQHSAEARGVVFEAEPGLVTDQPAVRGQATLDGDRPRLSIVYLFRVNTVVAAVETIGASDQEASVRAAAEHNAILQRDRLVAAVGSGQSGAPAH